MCCYDLYFPSVSFLLSLLCMSAHDEANYCPTAPLLMITECTADPAFLLELAAYRLRHTNNGCRVPIQHHGQLSKVNESYHKEFFLFKFSLSEHSNFKVAF